MIWFYRNNRRHEKKCSYPHAVQCDSANRLDATNSSNRTTAFIEQGQSYAVLVIMQRYVHTIQGNQIITEAILFKEDRKLRLGNNAIDRGS